MTPFSETRRRVRCRLVARCVISQRRNHLVASLIGRLGSSAFKLSTTNKCRCHSRARASLRNRHQGPSISWDSRMRRNYLSGGLAVRRTADPSDQANSPQPSSRKGHHSTTRWSSRFPSMAFDLLRLSCRFSCLSGPAELGAIDPDAVHDHRQSTRQRHDRLFHPAAPGDLHRPRLEPGPLVSAGQHDLGCFVKHHPHHLVPAF